MVYTITFNPALDYVLHMDKFIRGEVNRTLSEDIQIGGKGINVSCVLTALGIENTSLGFISGFTGDYLKKTAENMGLKTDFITLEQGLTRINIKIKESYETDINAAGPVITDRDISKLYEKTDMLKMGDILVLAGSVPASLSQNIYESVMKRLDGRGIKFVVDSTKDLLLNVLKYRPLLVKPNKHELGELFGVDVKTHDDVVKYAMELKRLGALNVLVSLAGDGAFLAAENNECYNIKAVKGKTINSVGAGDSMVAGFLAGLYESSDYQYALKLGAAAGTATAFSEGLATKEKIYKVLKKMQNLEITVF